MGCGDVPTVAREMIEAFLGERESEHDEIAAQLACPHAKVDALDPWPDGGPPQREPGGCARREQ